MFKFILPTILIGIAVALFFTFTKPLYETISLEREQETSYNEALVNSKALESERDKLTQKYNSFNEEDLIRLQKLLPDNIDNIRLILEIEKIASPYGMVLKNVKYDTIDKNTSTTQTIQTTNTTKGIKSSSGKDYGMWNLEFSTQGTYNSFLNLIKDLENNLRIVDISSIQFFLNTKIGLTSTLPDTYTYNFKIKTYWLKN
ncbi:MAG: hypothetical protein WC839_02860 [Candidatus Paceibacterota bacterium]